jgi:hypothetical protein
MLQNHTCDPTVVSNQAGFGSSIANNVIKGKLDMYHEESMVPPKLADVWELRIYVTISKITCPAILDHGSSVSAIPKSLYDHIDLPPIENCDIDLKLAVCSIANAHGRVNTVLVKLRMTLVHVDFIIMDIDGMKHSPIILSRPVFENYKCYH